MLYEKYVQGHPNVPWEWVCFAAWSYLRHRADTVDDLRNHRGETTGPIRGHQHDVLQRFYLEIQPAIQKKMISGRLSFYLNAAFKRGTIDAVRNLKKEWAWKKFLADMALPHALNEIESENNDGRDEQDFVTLPKPQAAESSTEDAEHGAEPYQFGPRPSGLPFSVFQPGQVSIRAATEAVGRVLKTATTAEKDLIVALTDGRTQKAYAEEHGLSTSKVNRMWDALDARVRTIAASIDGLSSVPPAAKVDANLTRKVRRAERKLRPDEETGIHSDTIVRLPEPGPFTGYRRVDPNEYPSGWTTTFVIGKPQDGRFV